MDTAEPVRLVADYVVPCEGAGTIIADGAVDIGPDGRITAVGTEAELEPGPTVRRIGGLLMPGLVNTHAHTPMTLVRSVGDGLPLDRWLTEAVWPLEAKMTPDDAHWGMALGSAEMLLAGVTTSCEMYLYEEALIEAAQLTGARLVMTPGVIAGLAPGGNVEPRIEEIDQFYHHHHDPEGRIHIGFAPHSVYDLTPAQCGEIAARAQAVGALFHIHLEETEAERQLVLDTHGATATKLLADQGVLEGPVLAAHGIWLDETDRRLLAEAGAAVAHCPQSNLKLGSGIASVPKLLADGVIVGVGTDGPASNDDLDLWEELRLAPLLARGSTHDPQALDAAGALDLATRSAAKALALDDIGELRPGAMADLIRLDIDVPAFSPCRPETMLSQLVFAGSARMVTDVWVGGAQVVSDRELITVEIGPLMVEVNQRARRLAG
ncbi:MAG: amidohydrolase [Actinomycetia bacterium]|nr:amidohydrolase [Actinomycetes bacterium]MCP4225181.1 amidohydrolase [Actinomycetes bacterium]MCP5030502.1 amidohydrolase [Actinomycetes bacterium]